MLLINDLISECGVRTFFDEVTLSKLFKKQDYSYISTHLNSVVEWSGYDLMNINSVEAKLKTYLLEELIKNLLLAS
jgi:hypothetical protein